MALAVTGYLGGVAIIGETSCTITNKAQTFELTDYGMRLCIPPNALPSDTVEQCELLIKVGISGPFLLPLNTSLVSAVYWLDTKPQCKFLQPLTLEIQHCAMTSQTSRLSFARCSQDSLPYTFEILEGGKFSSQSNYGSIQLDSFSMFAQLLKQYLPSLTGIGILKETSIKYRARLLYLRSGVCLRDIHFVITKDLKAHATVRYSNHWAFTIYHIAGKFGGH